MTIIISMSKLDDGRIRIGVARPQYDSKPVQSYASQKEARDLLTFGVDLPLQSAPTTPTQSIRDREPERSSCRRVAREGGLIFKGPR
jgi:hypothetical protein